MGFRSTHRITLYLPTGVVQAAHLLVCCCAVLAGLAVASIQQLGQGLDLCPEVDSLLIRRGEVRMQLLHLRLGRPQPCLRSTADPCQRHMVPLSKVPRLTSCHSV